MNIAFVHPDLGIGGAERLVVDAACSLQKNENQVIIYTSHCDKTHCFEEIKNDEIESMVFGDFLPTQIAGRFSILCAIIRQAWLILRLALSGKIKEHDVFIVDQLSFCLPILHYLKRSDARILFYCHFPDLKLASRDTTLRSLYRKPFDLLEQYTTICADRVVVNSNFTKGIFKETFPIISKYYEPTVLYPCVDTEASSIDDTTKEEMKEFFHSNERFFLSVNRFERAKNISLAIRVFAKLKKENLQFFKENRLKLIVAGGYDSRVRENVEHLIELEDLARSLGLKVISIRGRLFSYPASDVIFLPSVSSDIKDYLISKAEALLYTPGFEHFGIVPLEAMKFGTPVIAVNHGGPTETVVDDAQPEPTGYLRSNEVDPWYQACSQVVRLSDEERQKLSANSKKRVETYFSREAMGKAFSDNIDQMLTEPTSDRFSYEKFIDIFFVLGLVLLNVIPIVVAGYTYKRMRGDN
ncbi:hypothetical protein LJB42_001731 [Komagataella kurtzmanii]|nr:hypothetical protein LJB42_001731 [Komagataella kurtzmanii]